MDSDQHLKRYILSATMPVGLFDEDCRILALSHSAEVAWGIGDTTYVGRNYYRLSRDEELEAAALALHEPFHHGDLSGIMAYSELNGVYVASLWQPVRLSDGAPCTLVARIDVTIGPEMVEPNQSVRLVPLIRGSRQNTDPCDEAA